MSYYGDEIVDLAIKRYFREQGASACQPGRYDCEHDGKEQTVVLASVTGPLARYRYSVTKRGAVRFTPEGVA